MCHWFIQYVKTMVTLRGQKSESLIARKIFFFFWQLTGLKLTIALVVSYPDDYIYDSSMIISVLSCPPRASPQCCCEMRQLFIRAHTRSSPLAHGPWRMMWSGTASLQWLISLTRAPRLQQNTCRSVTPLYFTPPSQCKATLTPC